MLKITHRPTPEACTLELEGSVSGPWLAELQNQFDAARAAGGRGRPIHLNLAGVSFLDQEGARLIEEFVARGARITAASHFVTLMLQPPTTPVK